MTSDYTELNLYLEDMDDSKVDLWVYTNHNDFLIIKDVVHNPVRYQGWWTIQFKQYNRYASAHIEASKVMYFVTIDKRENEEYEQDCF